MVCERQPIYNVPFTKAVFAREPFLRMHQVNPGDLQ